jgi:hypothetical protein
MPQAPKLKVNIIVLLNLTGILLYLCNRELGGGGGGGAGK